jgi:hypothetical protein
MLNFVLVHSPLVGPMTWMPVAEELRQRGTSVAVPALHSLPWSAAPGGPAADAAQPYWAQHAAAVAAAVRSWGGRAPLVFAGHSGAGPLLPAIRAAVPNQAAAYLFVDAGLPVAGASRLSQFSPPAAEAFRQAAAERGGVLHVWSDDELREAIPDEAVRGAFVAELHARGPLPLAVYEEPLPVFAGWPDAPCEYLRFGANPAYDAPAAEAQRRGWPVRSIEGDHFHMLVDPPAVAAALLELTHETRHAET